jgi:hypothetical protein
LRAGCRRQRAAFYQRRWGFNKRTANLETNNYPFDEARVRETAERSYQALQEYQIFDSLMPAAFHALTEFAAMSFHSDRSMITLIDRKRQTEYSMTPIR